MNFLYFVVVLTFVLQVQARYHLYDRLYMFVACIALHERGAEDLRCNGGPKYTFNLDGFVEFNKQYTRKFASTQIEIFRGTMQIGMNSVNLNPATRVEMVECLIGGIERVYTRFDAQNWDGRFNGPFDFEPTGNAASFPENIRNLRWALQIDAVQAKPWLRIIEEKAAIERGIASRNRIDALGDLGNEVYAKANEYSQGRRVEERLRLVPLQEWRQIIIREHGNLSRLLQTNAMLQDIENKRIQISNLESFYEHQKIVKYLRAHHAKCHLV